MSQKAIALSNTTTAVIVILEDGPTKRHFLAPEILREYLTDANLLALLGRKDQLEQKLSANLVLSFTANNNIAAISDAK